MDEKIKIDFLESILEIELPEETFWLKDYKLLNVQWQLTSSNL